MVFMRMKENTIAQMSHMSEDISKFNAAVNLLTKAILYTPQGTYPCIFAGVGEIRIRSDKIEHGTTFWPFLVARSSLVWVA